MVVNEGNRVPRVPNWGLQVMGVAMVLVVAQFVLEVHEELQWRASRVAAKIEAQIESNIAGARTLRNAELPAPTVPYAVPYAVPQIKKENTQVDKLVDKLDGRFKKQMFDQVVIGHVHMAKTSGTTLNGNLSMHFERVCGHKGYSYDAYQGKYPIQNDTTGLSQCAS